MSLPTSQLEYLRMCYTRKMDRDVNRPCSCHCFSLDSINNSVLGFFLKLTCLKCILHKLIYPTPVNFFHIYYLPNVYINIYDSYRRCVLNVWHLRSRLDKWLNENTWQKSNSSLWLRMCRWCWGHSQPLHVDLGYLWADVTVFRGLVCIVCIDAFSHFRK